MTDLEDLIDVVIPDELQDLIDEYKATFGTSPNIWQYRNRPGEAAKAIAQALKTETELPTEDMQEGDVL